MADVVGRSDEVERKICPLICDFDTSVVGYNYQGQIGKAIYYSTPSAEWGNTRQFLGYVCVYLSCCQG